MNKWTLISYYTENTYYEDVAREHILASLENYLNIEHRILSVPNLGDWQKNTHYKAKFIKEQLQTLQRPVVFVDCDARIEQYPSLFDSLECDLAFHTWVIRHSRTDLLSGTMYFNYNDIVLSLLDDWIEELNKTTEWEQRVLAKVVKKWEGRIKVFDLPGSYCKIFDRMPHVTEKPVIQHFQKSRLWRSSNSLSKDAKEIKSY